jgi:hypothetical protein
MSLKHVEVVEQAIAAYGRAGETLDASRGSP